MCRSNDSNSGEDTITRRSLLKAAGLFWAVALLSVRFRANRAASLPAHRQATDSTEAYGYGGAPTAAESETAETATEHNTVANPDATSPLGSQGYGEYGFGG